LRTVPDRKSIKTVGKADAAGMTFVFVTPRRWPGKTVWIKEAKAAGNWKDVRAYDASDLEQWLEQSVPGQTWLANELKIPADGVRSLDRCWQDWSSATHPPFPGELFSSAVEEARRTVLERLNAEHPKPIFIGADSTEEALAFLSELFSSRGGEDLATYRDRVVVFDRQGTLPRLAETKQMFIPVVWSRDVERELTTYASKLPSIVVQPRNLIAGKADIMLESVNHQLFSRALETTGCSHDQIKRLAAESGRSLTVLRRRMSADPRLHSPDWAEDADAAAKLVPFLLVGTWSASCESDRLGLELLADGQSYEALEREFQQLSQLNDAPVWSVGTFRGVASKIDLLHAIERHITAADLQRYYDIAQLVLGEDDPALDLPEDKRWAAAIHGKKREFTQAFRSGISETLVLLAVHGPNLSFMKRLGMDLETETVRLVRKLLPDPLTTRILKANDDDLPTYAEAAPTEFLTILEQDLRQPEPAVLGLLKPVNADLPFASPSRSGLLWALEGLAWNPATLHRVVWILVKLAELEIKDNWVNTPTNTLLSIFRVVAPQTEATDDQRLVLLKEMITRQPAIAWRICVAQFNVWSDSWSDNHKPRWRADGYGFGEPLRDRARIMDQMSAMVEVALTWPNYTADMLCDLIERLPVLSDADQARVWSLVRDWAAGKASDSDKANLREQIRVSTLTRRAKRRGVDPKLAKASKDALITLEPSDIINRHEWMFRQSWVDESADEIEDSDSLEYDERERRIERLRVDALRDVLEGRGVAGFIELAERGNAAFQVGYHAVREVLSLEQAVELLQLAVGSALTDDVSREKLRRLAAGLLRSSEDAKLRQELIQSTLKRQSGDFAVELLLQADFDRLTWDFVDRLGSAEQDQYWADVVPNLIRASEAHISEAIERMLKAGRPRAVFAAVHWDLERVEVRALHRLLSEMAEDGNDKAGEYRVQQHDIEEAFELLNKSGQFALDEMAGLEYAYLEVLERPYSRRGGYGIPNLEKYIEKQPDMFVQAVVWTYKRRDDLNDPESYQVPSERVKDLANKGFSLLQALKFVPGQKTSGEIDQDRLSAWIASVRKACRELARAAIADVCIGNMLSACPADEDGTWPCEPVREVMEQIGSEDMMRGAHTGVYNSRGVVTRGEGGDQERALAAKYRKWAASVAGSHPFVASQLLEKLAETYEDEAKREDMDAELRHRLR
jgi:hypothetical protein